MTDRSRPSGRGHGVNDRGDGTPGTGVIDRSVKVVQNQQFPIYLHEYMYIYINIRIYSLFILNISAGFYTNFCSNLPDTK